MRFKTKKQKLIHHNNLEPECQIERSNLVKLIGYFKRCLFNLYTNYGLNETELKNDSDYINLKLKYLETEKKLIDSDFFFYTLGDKFSDLPINLDE